jgi:hypothetical protein
LDGVKDPQWGTLSCNFTNNWAVFGQYVTGYESVYTIPANSFKRISPTITMPKSAAGTVYGCVSVYNEEIYQKTIAKWWVSMIVHNTIPFELFVDTKVAVGLELTAVGDIQGTNMVQAPAFVTKQADGSYLLAVGFKNTWWLDESVEVKGTITDVLGNVIELAPQTKTVGPDGYGDVRYNIPNYLDIRCGLM